MKMFYIRALLVLLVGLYSPAGAALAFQGSTGRPTRTPPPKSPTNPPPPGRPGPRSPKPPGARSVPPAPAPPCEAAEVIVRCGVPGCEVLLDGRQQGSTDNNGELRIDAPRGPRTIAIRKAGYEGDSRPIKVDCGASEVVNLSLRIRPVTLRIRTSPPEAEVFLNDPPKSIGRSDAQGLLSYVATAPALLFEARRTGYLADSRRVNVTPESAAREIVLTLKPLPARVALSVNVAGARVQVDEQPPRPLAVTPLSLTPGRHRLKVEALGYAPAVVEVEPGPDETLKQSVTLRRLAVAELTAQAEDFYLQRAYENVLTLCRYVFETESASPPAHRLAGLSHLARQEYAESARHLAQALAGGEVVKLPVRRHARESFDPAKGHDACEGFLWLGKSEVEFRGVQVTTENFKVAYDQVQLLGVQLKKNVAACLSAKITVARGKRQDYNFFSFDKELTQAGRPYLEMLQSLLHAH